MAVIRAATLDDLKELIKFKHRLQRHLEASNPRIWPKDTQSDEYIHETILEIDDKEINIFIAEEEGEPVGFISGRVLEKEDEQTAGLILQAYVNPERRNQGTGHKLVNELLAMFQRKNVGEVTLRYVVGNREAEQFWRGLGFTSTLTIVNADMHTIKKRLQGKPFNQA
ncbi:MAG: GNAT family N-acetyltransferase [Candidatus Bathyarchaeota archaeon]|nr:GNAT family N-acetyltransferase [Candidatus Bathyarchaeota archaeon]